MEQKLKKRELDGLPELQQRIELWRRTREKPGRMPEGLWREAAKLARKHGVNPVKEALGLDYYSHSAGFARNPEVSAQASEVSVRTSGEQESLRLGKHGSAS